MADEIKKVSDDFRYDQLVKQVGDTLQQGRRRLAAEVQSTLMRNRLFKAMMGSVMAVMLSFAVAGCGAQSESDQDSAPTETKAEKATEAPAPYDIASNLTFEDGQTTDGQQAAMLDTDYFTLTLAPADDWAYEVNDESSITIYDVAARDAGVGGHLATIIAYDKGDKSYEQLQKIRDGAADSPLVLK